MHIILTATDVMFPPLFSPVMLWWNPKSNCLYWAADALNKSSYVTVVTCELHSSVLMPHKKSHGWCWWKPL